MEFMLYSLLWVMQQCRIYIINRMNPIPIRQPRKPEVRNPSKAAASHHPVFKTIRTTWNLYLGFRVWGFRV